MTNQHDEKPKPHQAKQPVIKWLASGIVLALVGALVFFVTNPANALSAPPTPETSSEKELKDPPGSFAKAVAKAVAAEEEREAEDPDSDSDSDSDPAMSKRRANSGFIGSWDLLSLSINGVEVDVDKPVTLKAERSSVSGFGGCNYYGAKMKMGNDGQVNISRPGSTKKACQKFGPSLESRYFTALTLVTTWDGTPNGFSLSSDRVFMTFKPEGADPNHFQTGMPRPNPPATPPAKPNAIAELLGSWDLSELTVNGSEVALAESVTPRLTFENSRFNGFAACNSYFGSFDADAAGGLAMPAVFSTKVRCFKGMEVEARYLAALRDVNTWKASSSELTLTGDSVSMTFVPEPSSMPEELAGSYELSGLKLNGAEIDLINTPTLTIEDSEFSGFAGCNRYWGSLNEADESAGMFPMAASTKMACRDGGSALEARYLSALRSVTGWERTSGRITFTADSANDVSMNFVPKAVD